MIVEIIDACSHFFQKFYCNLFLEFTFAIEFHLFYLSLQIDASTEFVFFLQQFAKDGLLNIVGGCCGTTPEHIK